ncbi:cytochrome-c peroxidase [Pontibacter silvestris]|uniref:Cytochrome-c peroxidase n=1 Tax=Pontibacter silvestris TaxID=2305183 RepID=A0ABW4X461_9BACT|nr:cytochrome c peroxidase [Pontibacter silvestris]MCC9138314.1 cytochrome-c peroxidase [Pontibacter silvestris]
MSENMVLLRNLILFVVAGFVLACSSEKDAEPKVESATPVPYQLEIPAVFPQNYTIPADNPMIEEGVELGRYLFYEKMLSGNNTMSCGSCHQQDKAFTDGKALAVGIDGIAHKRSTMSLGNVLWATQLNWDGSALSLEQQARGPIENQDELHENLAGAAQELQATALYPPMFQKAFGTSTITEEDILKALAQFVRTLVSSHSRYDRYLQGKEELTPEELEGMQLFMTHPEPSIGLRGGNCGDCHGGTLTSMNTFHNNGLDETFTDNGLGDVTGNPVHNGLFKAPSLRNIALTAPYMHDGRFQSLEDVLDHYNDHLKYNSPNLDPLIIEASNEVNGKTLLITQEEKRKIIAFLHTLTDATFITDERFSDPFTQ